MGDDQERSKLEMRAVYAGSLAGVVAGAVVGWTGTIEPMFWGWLVGTVCGAIVAALPRRN